LSQAEIGVGAIATLAWQCQIPPTCSRKREHGTPELRRDKALVSILLYLPLCPYCSGSPYNLNVRAIKW
jgi:hypothetical protein